MPTLSRSSPARLRWFRPGYGVLVFLAAALIGYVLWSYAWPKPADPSVPTALRAQVLHPGVLRVHALAGAFALLVGLVQLGPQGRMLPLGWHRRFGYAYSGAVLISGLAGLWLAQSSEGAVPAHFGFGTLAVLWLSLTALGVSAAIRGDVAAHRRAMAHSLALTCAGITLRLQLPLCGLAGWEFADYYPWVAWTCWVPNLVFAEFVLRRK